jgi:hypothetical protein
MAVAATGTDFRAAAVPRETVGVVRDVASAGGDVHTDVALEHPHCLGDLLAREPG